MVDQGGPSARLASDDPGIAALIAILNAGIQIGGISTNPTSLLTRFADTTAYAQNDAILSHTTAANAVVPSFNAPRVPAGGFQIPRFRLVTDKAAGWDGVLLRARFWTAAPTYTNGDNGAYAVATGAAGYLGKSEITLEQFGDGAAGIGTLVTGSAIFGRLAAGLSVFWDLQYIGAAALTPASGQKFTLIPEISQD